MKILFLFFAWTVIPVLAKNLTEHALIALNGVEEFLNSTIRIGCYALGGQNLTLLADIMGILASEDESYYAGQRFFYSDLVELDECLGECCDYEVLFIESLDELEARYKTFSQYHAAIFINLNEDNIPDNKVKNFAVIQDNVMLFHRVGDFFSIYDKRQGKFFKFNWWNGKNFVNDKMLIRPSLRGEAARMMWSYFEPFCIGDLAKNGTLNVTAGIFHAFLEMVLAWEGIIYQQYGVDVQFGHVFDNGTGFGGQGAVATYDTDLNAPQMCGYTMPLIVNRKAPCVAVWFMDGIEGGHFVMMRRNPPSISWEGLITPYTPTVWASIGGTVVLATLALGFFTKITFGKTKKVDWMLHFLDALHPMCGRNMAVPGFDAAHIQRQREIKAFEVFLLFYCVTCVVINTGYEGNLKSHLSAIRPLKPINTLNDFADAQHEWKTLIHIGTAEGGYIEAILALKHTEREKIHEVADNPDLFKPRSVPWNEYVKLPLDGHALMGVKVSQQFNIKKWMTFTDGTTDMYIVPDVIRTMYTGFFISHMNRFKSTLEHRMLQCVDYGIYSHLHKEQTDEDRIEGRELLVRDVPLPESFGNAAYSQIDLNVMRPLFIIWAIAMGVALLVLLVENYGVKAKLFN